MLGDHVPNIMIIENLPCIYNRRAHSNIMKHLTHTDWEHVKVEGHRSGIRSSFLCIPCWSNRSMEVLLLKGIASHKLSRGSFEFRMVDNRVVPTGILSMWSLYRLNVNCLRLNSSRDRSIHNVGFFFDLREGIPYLLRPIPIFLSSMGIKPVSDLFTMKPIALSSLDKVGFIACVEKDRQHILSSELHQVTLSATCLRDWVFEDWVI